MKKGFTLIELLIVIGIVAILATGVVVILNPSELMKQGRDAQRINDLNNIANAINLYISDSDDPDLRGEYSDCSSRTFILGEVGVNNGPADYSFSGTAGAGRNNFVCHSGRATTGGNSNWLPVNFSSMGTASPITVLPIDPITYTTGSNYVYRYACDNTNKTYELNACFESKKYESSMENDGGDRPSVGAVISGNCSSDFNSRWYEIGTQPGLNL